MTSEEINLEPFTDKDFAMLISWIESERDLIQFAGPIFKFPLTNEQLSEYLADKNRYPFKITYKKDDVIIGHCEAYRIDNETIRLSRILIGNKTYRGRGLGRLATYKLINWCMDTFKPKIIDLNVYDFNAVAIKCYESLGFVKSGEIKITNFGNETWKSERMILETDKLNK